MYSRGRHAKRGQHSDVGDTLSCLTHYASLIQYEAMNPLESALEVI